MENCGLEQTAVHRQNLLVLMLSHHSEGLATAYLRIVGGSALDLGAPNASCSEECARREDQRVVLASHRPRCSWGRRRRRFNLGLPDRVVFENDELMSRLSTSSQFPMLPTNGNHHRAPLNQVASFIKDSSSSKPRLLYLGITNRILLEYGVHEKNRRPRIQ
jgi:hypothetical protein